MSRFDFATNLSYAGSCRLPYPRTLGGTGNGFGYATQAICVDGDEIWHMANLNERLNVGRCIIPGSLADKSVGYLNLPQCTFDRWEALPSWASAMSPYSDIRFNGLCKYSDTHLLINRNPYYDVGTNPRYPGLFAIGLGAEADAGPWYFRDLDSKTPPGVLVKLPSWFASLVGRQYAVSGWCVANLGAAPLGCTAFGLDVNILLAANGEQATSPLIYHGPTRAQAHTFRGTYLGLADMWNNNSKWGGCAVLKSGDASCVMFGGNWLGGYVYYSGAYYGRYGMQRLYLYSLSDIMAVRNGEIDSWGLQPYQTINFRPYLMAAADHDNQGTANVFNITHDIGGNRLVVSEYVAQDGYPPAIHIFNVV